MDYSRRKIRLIERNAKCRHLKKIELLKGLCGRCLSVWGPEPHSPPFLHTAVYMSNRRVYSLLIHTGKGGRAEPERRLEGQEFTKLGRKCQHDWQYKLRRIEKKNKRKETEVDISMRWIGAYRDSWGKIAIKTTKHNITTKNIQSFCRYGRVSGD